MLSKTATKMASSRNLRSLRPKKSYVMFYMYDKLVVLISDGSVVVHLRTILVEISVFSRLDYSVLCPTHKYHTLDCCCLFSVVSQTLNRCCYYLLFIVYWLFIDFVIESLYNNKIGDPN